MGTKPSFSHSSLLVSLPALATALLCCVLAAFFNQRQLAFALMLVFLLAGAARLWAVLSARKVSVTLSGEMSGLFPGESARLVLTVHNGKFLPLVWMELFFPLAQNLCLTPGETRKPDDWELAFLQEEKYSDQLVGEKRCAFLLWYETTHLEIRWTANRRGVYSTSGWRLRTGDGFGLAQVECPLSGDEVHRFAVYPKLTSVRPDLFLRSLWNADTGTRGVMEDPTVIRSTRDYLPTDSLKHINWRLTARGLPLSVNVYEDILPKNVHFLFDGESFSGAQPHLPEMEEALSILASELVRLEEAQVLCGLSLCQGQGGPAVNLMGGACGTEDLLYALAAYQPQEKKRDSESGSVVDQIPVFDVSSLAEAIPGVGRFYYIVYDTAHLAGRTLLTQYLDRTCTSILTYQEDKPFGDYETVCLRWLKEETHG